MGSKTITVRLYRQHDMDLIRLYRIKSFKFQKKLKNALIAIANNESYQLEIPDDKPVEGYVPKSFPMHFYLNPQKKEEANAIKLLDEIRVGYKNSFLKALIRNSLTYLPLDGYIDDSGFKMRFSNIYDLKQIIIADSNDGNDNNKPEKKKKESCKNKTKALPKSPGKKEEISADEEVKRHKQNISEDKIRTVPKEVPSPASVPSPAPVSVPVPVPVPRAKPEIEETAIEPDDTSQNVDLDDLFGQMNALAH